MKIWKIMQNWRQIPKCGIILITNLRMLKVSRLEKLLYLSQGIARRPSFRRSMTTVTSSMTEQMWGAQLDPC